VRRAATQPASNKINNPPNPINENKAVRIGAGLFTEEPGKHTDFQ
jgi:hypothetical protein